MPPPLNGFTMYSGSAAELTCIGIAFAPASSRSSASASAFGAARDAGAGRVGRVLALPRDRQLDDRRRERRKHHHRERSDEAERAVVVAAQEQQHVADPGDRAADRRPRRVWIRMSRLRMWASSWASTPRSSLSLSSCVMPSRNRDRRVLRAAARREGVRLAGRNHVEPRHREAGRVGQLPHDLVQPRRLLLGERLCMAHAQRDLVREPVGDQVQTRRPMTRNISAVCGPADQLAEHDQQAGQRGKQRPSCGSRLSSSTCVTSFMSPIQLSRGHSCPRSRLPCRVGVSSRGRVSGIGSRPDQSGATGRTPSCPTRLG